jgi:hypothetical protein
VAANAEVRLEEAWGEEYEAWRPRPPSGNGSRRQNGRLNQTRRWEILRFDIISYHDTSYKRPASELRVAQYCGKRRNSMARLATRATVRTLAIFLVLASILGTVVSFRGSTKPAHAQQAARVGVVSGYFGASARSDVDGALAAFAPNASFIGARSTGNCSTQTPCTDPTGIRQQLEGNATLHVCQTIRSV